MTDGLVGCLLGVLLGMRHAVEPDHLAAVTTLNLRARSPWRGMLLGAWWGLGHALALLGLGGVLVVMQTRLRPGQTALLEGLVGVMLVALGIAAVRRAWTEGTMGPVQRHSHGKTPHAHATTGAHLHVGRLTLSTEYPFGMFRAWSVLNPDQSLLVYPAPEPGAPPLPRGESRDGHARPTPGGDDWQGLREFRTGDARRLVAWKASARHDRLLVKEFASPVADELLLDFERLGSLPNEQRIARLTRWVLDAARLQTPFTLVVPGQRIGPGYDAHHVERCLRELALLP